MVSSDTSIRRENSIQLEPRCFLIPLQVAVSAQIGFPNQAAAIDSAVGKSGLGADELGLPAHVGPQKRLDGIDRFGQCATGRLIADRLF